MYEFLQCLTHDLRGLVKYVVLPLRQILRPDAMHLDNQPDRRQLWPPNIHPSKRAVEATIIHITNLKLLSAS